MAKINVEKYIKLVKKELVIDTTAVGGTVFKYVLSDHHVRRNAELARKEQQAIFKLLRKRNVKMSANQKEMEAEFLKRGGDILDLREQLTKMVDVHAEFYDGFEGDLPTYEELKGMFKVKFPEFHESALKGFLKDVYAEFAEALKEYSESAPTEKK